MIFTHTEEFKKSIEVLISGMLPHNNYKGNQYRSILNYLNILFKENELDLEYNIMLKVFNNINKIFMVNKNYVPKVSKELVASILETNIYDLLQKDGYLYKQWFTTRGIDTNFAVDSSLRIASDEVYNSVMDLYERCFEYEMDEDLAITSISSLSPIYMDSVMENLVSTLAKIINDGHWYNRKMYKGSADSFEYNKLITSELYSRLDELDIAVNKNKSISEKVIEALHSVRNKYSRLADFGIEPLDDSSPFSTHEYCVLVAESNVGKTQLTYYLANQFMKEGKKVKFVFGESTEDIAMSGVLRNYIYKRKKYYVNNYAIRNYDKIDNNTAKLIDMYSMEMATSELIEPLENLDMIDAYEDLVRMYERDPFSCLIIDHTGAMTTKHKTKEGREKHVAFSFALRRFKKEYPVNIILLSHLSAEGKSYFKQNGNLYGQSDITAHSSDYFRDADKVFFLYSDDSLEKQSIRGLSLLKSRDMGKSLVKEMYLKVDWDCGEWVYDIKYQVGGEESMSEKQALEAISKEYDLTDTLLEEL